MSIPAETRLTVYRWLQVVVKESNIIFDRANIFILKVYYFLFALRNLIGALRVIPGGNQVDGLPPASSFDNFDTHFCIFIKKSI